MIKARIDYPSFVSVDEAETLQKRLSGLVERQDRLPTVVERAAGLDVAYEVGGDRLFAAVVTEDVETCSVLETATHEDEVRFPYVPGLFSFREFPPLAEALLHLGRTPDLLICDGHGVAHPRRFGLACHVGVVFDIPTIGCAKSNLIGEYDQPGASRGDYSPISHEGETIGAALRTRDRTRPVFVSTGHRVSLPTACEWILRLTPHYRQPDPLRHANLVANRLRHRNLSQPAHPLAQ